MLRTNRCCVQIGARGRSNSEIAGVLHRLHSSISDHLQSGEQRMTIVNQVSLSSQDSLLRVRAIARDLAHPQSIRGTRDPYKLDLPRGKFDEKQNHKSLQPSPGPHQQT